MSIGGASCYWYIVSDQNAAVKVDAALTEAAIAALDEVDQEIVTEEAVQKTTPSEETAKTDALTWWAGLFG